MPNDAPRVAFLGVVERDAQVPDGNTNLRKYNILGLKRTVLSHIFPLPATLRFAFALYDPQEGYPVAMRVRNEAGAELFTFTLETVNAMSQADAERASPLRQEGAALVAGPKEWIFIVTGGGEGKMPPVMQPGTLNFLLVEDGSETLVGRLAFVLIDAQPLTEERKAAIRSDPRAAKTVRINLQCSKCNGAVKAYAGLERVADHEAEGWVWYENLPDSYACSCANVTVDLTTWRRNLHGLLGTLQATGEGGALVPLYEKDALTSIYTNFAALLGEDAPEETFQKFIEENPVLLHQFAPEKLFFKAPILTLRKTDFALVNHQHELILIELERPDTKLLKVDGNIHSDLQHALGQAREWLHIAEEQRLAVLDCIKVERKEVGAVRAVVIAGRDAGYNADHLRRLKGDAGGYAKIKIMTYDDLLANFGSLVRGVGAL